MGALKGQCLASFIPQKSWYHFLLLNHFKLTYFAARESYERTQPKHREKATGPVLENPDGFLVEIGSKQRPEGQVSVI